MIWFWQSGEDDSGQTRQSSAKSYNLDEGRDDSEGFLHKPTCCEVAGEASLYKTVQAEFGCWGSFSTILYFVAERFAVPEWVSQAHQDVTWQTILMCWSAVCAKFPMNPHLWVKVLWHTRAHTPIHFITLFLMTFTDYIHSLSLIPECQPSSANAKQ